MYTEAHRQAGHASRWANVLAGLAEHFNHEVRCAIHCCRLVGALERAVDQTVNCDNLTDLVERPDHCPDFSIWIQQPFRPARLHQFERILAAKFEMPC
jgi:hypothetical protein